MAYSTEQVASLYNVSKSTIRNWVFEFEEFLSPTAKPGRYKNRHFSIEDMTVISLIAEMKSKGATFDDIHLSLKNDERGEAPDLDPEEVMTLAGQERVRHLSLQIEQLTYTINKLKEELATAHHLADQAQQWRDKNIQLETELRITQEQLKITQQNYTEAIKKIEVISLELGREVGTEYSRGYIEGFERGRKDSDD
jgi:DNA-binding transcriptional MerR regulator